MKKLFFLLLFPLWGTGGLFAAVTVTPLGADYHTKTVTFKVEWQNSTIPYNNCVWVWIDLCPVSGTTPAMSFSTATVSNPAKTAGNGTISGGTTRGFFIEYANATNAGTTVTAVLSNATGNFNWCAYGSDFPPNAVVNAGGGYTLRGTPPFTINGSQTIDATTFGAGICITSIADLTGRPDGFATPALTVSTTNPAARCGAGTVTLTAAAGGGTTTAMTYTWTVGNNNYTTTGNKYTTASLAASAAYSVKVRNANNCESNTASGNITVNLPGNNNQPAHATCGCATGTTNCSGTCKTTRTYETNDGVCTGECGLAYTQLRNQCDVVIKEKYGTYDAGNQTCLCPAPTANPDIACKEPWYGDYCPYSYVSDCEAWCKSNCQYYGFTYYWVSLPYECPYGHHVKLCSCSN